MSKKQQNLNESLYCYAEIGMISRVKELLADGADINYVHQDYKGRPLGSVLDKAVYSGNPEMVRFLLDHGAKISKDTLLRACRHAIAAEEMMLEKQY